MRKLNATYDKPVILLSQARTYWFVLRNTAYPLMSCPAGVFRRFIAKQSPTTWTDKEVHMLLDQAELDDMTRWFILLSLGKFLKRQNQVLPFYESQQLAINAMRANSERLKEGKRQSHATRRYRRPVQTPDTIAVQA